MKSPEEIYNSLYPHQKLVYDRIFDCSKNNPNMHAIVSLPTGGGKTRLAVAYAISEGFRNQRNILWVANSTFLLEQAVSTFEYFLGEDLYKMFGVLIHGKSGKTVEDIKDRHRLIFISIQTASLYEYEDYLTRDTLIIVDEAHHSTTYTYQFALRAFAENKQMLGLTATPLRIIQKENCELYDFYSTRLEIDISVFDLINEGLLVPPRYINVCKLNLSTPNIEEEYCRPIIDHYLQYQEQYGKTLIFAQSNRHACILGSEFKKRFNCEVSVVHSDIPNSEDLIRLFTQSPSGILINVKKLTEGVDIPDIQTVIVARNPGSCIETTQIIGRALRKPHNSTKEHAYIVNFTGIDLEAHLIETTPEKCNERIKRDYLRYRGN